MRKRTIILLLMLQCSIGIVTNAQEPLPAGELTLDQAIALGIKNNIDVQQSRLDMKVSEIGWHQAQLNRLPDLNAYVGHGINQGRSIDPFTNSYINQRVDFANYNAQSTLPLFAGLSLHNAVKQNALAYEASKMDLQQAKDNLTLNIILAFLDVLSSEDLLIQTRAQADLSRKQVERLEVLNENGGVAPYLLSDLKGQLANDELSIIANQNRVETAKISLCQLLNVPYTKNFTLQKFNPAEFLASYGETSDKIYETALEKFAQIRAVALRTLSAEKQVKVARGQQFPTLSFSAGATSNISSAARQDIFLNNTEVTSTDYVLVNNVQTPVIKQQSNFMSQKLTYTDQLKNNIFSSFALNLNIPIFNALRNRNRVKLAQVNLENNQVVEKNTRTRLQQNIEQAYLNMNTAADRHKILLEQVKAFDESFRAAEIRFNEGVLNSVEYLTARNNRDRSQINLIIARYDYVLRTKILDYYQGKAR
jgi:outer membrane protein